jgi:hypothetical protein
MPNFDGNGPLKRGRIIGRGRGPCKQTGTECEREGISPETRHGHKTPAQLP